MFSLAAACSRKSSSPGKVSQVASAQPTEQVLTQGGPVPQSDSPLARFLPDKAGAFEAGILTSEPQFVRRSYSRGSTRISVTIATPGATPMTFEEWVKMSQGSPAVTLDVPANTAAGFYDCTSPSAGAECNVHIHFRAGYHLELMGEGNAHRTDFDELLRGLPLQFLTKTPS